MTTPLDPRDTSVLYKRAFFSDKPPTNVPRPSGADAQWVVNYLQNRILQQHIQAVSARQLPEDRFKTVSQLPISDEEGALPALAVKDVLRDPDGIVLTNHFPITLKEDLVLHSYAISWTGISEGVSRAKRRIMFEKFIRAVPQLRDQQHLFATDYSGKIFTFGDIFSPDFINNYEIETNVPGQKRGSRESRQSVKIFVTDPKLTPVRDFLEFTRGADTKEAIWCKYDEVLQALNAFLSKSINSALRPTSGTFAVGSTKVEKVFSKAYRADLQNKFLDAHIGFSATIKPVMYGQPVLQVNTLTGAFYKPMRVSDYLGNTDFDKKELVGLRVLLWRKKGDPPQGYSVHSDDEQLRTIYGFSELKPKDQKFELEQEGKKKIMVSVAWNLKFGETNRQDPKPWVPEYDDSNKDDALNEYNDLNDYVCVNTSANKGKPVWQIAQHLYVLAYQMYKKPITDGKATGAMVKFAARSPYTNLAAILDHGMGALGLTIGANKNFNLGSEHDDMIIHPKFLQIPRAYLETAVVQYSECDKYLEGNNRWDLVGQKFYKAGHHAPQASSADAKPKAAYFTASGATGFKDRPKPIAEALFSRTRTYGLPEYNLLECTDYAGDSIADIESMLRWARLQKCSLALFVLPKKDLDVYSNIKTRADQMGLHTIVMTEKKSMSDQLYANVLMKVNLKRQGINHIVQQLSTMNALGSTLILGADVTHPGGHSVAGCPSIAALVGNVDNTFGRFGGSMRMQEGKTEIIEDLRDMAVERFEAWAKEHDGNLPESIIYYRDGVGEGMFSDLRMKELGKIRAAYRHCLVNQVKKAAENRAAEEKKAAEDQAAEATTAAEDQATEETTASKGKALVVPEPAESAKQGKTNAEKNRAKKARQAANKAKAAKEGTPQSGLQSQQAQNSQQPQQPQKAAQPQQTGKSQKSQQSSGPQQAQPSAKKQKDTRTIPITTIVVIKRHHTRFYPTTVDDMTSDKNFNCRPGLLVDDNVTSPYHMDFFLQSHEGIMGTARPTHYHVLEDGMGLGSQNIQNITNWLCHTYVRATLPVSYAAPTYYADRLCERGRAYLRDYFTQGKKGGTVRDHQNKDLMKSRIEKLWKEMSGTSGALSKKQVNPWHESFNNTMFWM